MAMGRMEMKWWYLTFGDSKGFFRGAAVIQGLDIESAIANAIARGIDQGDGLIRGGRIVENYLDKLYPESVRNRLIGEKELREKMGFKTIREQQKEGVRFPESWGEDA